MLTMDTDRRRHGRVAAERPCKVFDPRSSKYLAASTCDLSSRGVLLKLPHGLDIAPGQTLHVAIAQKRRETVLRAAEMAPMRLVRTMRTEDGGMCLGLELIDTTAAQPLERPADYRRAA